jgi:hypothetical protein
MSLLLCFCASIRDSLIADVRIGSGSASDVLPLAEHGLIGRPEARNSLQRGKLCNSLAPNVRALLELVRTVLFSSVLLPSKCRR